jgi:hypothetical protein
MPIEVTLPEASAMIERGQTTVREWVQERLVVARKDPRGRWLIERDSLLARAAIEAAPTGRSRVGAMAVTTARTRASHASNQGEPSLEVAAILRAENEHLKQLLREERERCRRLEEERTQHMAEMRALLAKDGNGGKEGVISRWIRR